MDVTIVLLWYFGGLVVAFLLLEMILPRGRPTKKGTPESSAYRWDHQPDLFAYVRGLDYGDRGIHPLVSKTRTDGEFLGLVAHIVGIYWVHSIGCVFNSTHI